MTLRSAYADQSTGHSGPARRDPSLTLLELCEPLFLYVCRVNRSTRLTSGTRYQAAQVAGEVKALLSHFARDSTGTRLERQFQKIRQPLLLFVDDIISTSNLPFAGDWHRISAGGGESSDSQKFFDALDLDLADADADSTERLAVFYVCLGLGFGSSRGGDRKRLDGYLAKTAARIRGLMDTDDAMKLCPEAYHHTIRRPIAEPVARPLAGIGIAAVVLIAVALALNIALYVMHTSDLRNALERFNRSFPPRAVSK